MTCPPCLGTQCSSGEEDGRLEGLSRPTPPSSLPRSAAGSDEVVLPAGAQSNLQPQLVTPRMEVCFAAASFGRVGRMKVESSQITRGAHATRALALLLWCCRVANGAGEARAEPRLDERALRAEAICLQLGNRAADSADLFVGRPVEEAQTHCRHCGPPGKLLERNSEMPDAGENVLQSGCRE